MEDKTAKDILEIVGFLKDNMVCREEMDQKFEQMDQKFEQMDRRFELRLDQKLTEVKSEIMTHMDGFIGLHQKLDLELVALRAKYDRLESYVMKLAHHANIKL
ncbi:MAG: hypothetical protein UU40_C0010G0013 [Candidatus Uhrbacteria bacterium GW2011_GWD2_41_121]|uniref:Uncharacterized protein n=1 Tax=Candidatus Uhrbacteria bacterium GW2011_GWC1_41_20 TaxID=1618983 RepID=A0A0G0VEM4_9BACT|nr:MAG: hypothetical protein UT52_C0008G0012 [Candidatus Uhrbacteria bacterium GW2011_GWE1_39_46]KKR64065.1 MAG: hypothetical protein UU04_C0006G0012 [Candidatus Uhrbacteria bacterium GW2011_GWC2_40_450]KKR89457.1 MAG: hypothetical protein UU36_C0027G0007 [Candidatus Uhrbacteria bacterium GW2011_GWE2_41_1153]KKR89990.1 MAG: hypothetical protein UU40_C0010G0013 [Candidatus Uhrbacteria bacterium GW2011_GWD2_41_121]KKR95899.1 MAG: hypothetical protein UU46_C0011G0006 [Candidatus Uhrbacteria bacter